MELINKVSGKFAASFRREAVVRQRSKNTLLPWRFGFREANRPISRFAW